MNLKTAGISALVAIASVSLAACGGGGGGSSPAALTPSQSASTATAHGTLKLILPHSSSAGHKPAYISANTNNVYFNIDGGAQYTCDFSAPPTCTIAWSTTVGTHNFYVEAVDTNSGVILSEGAALTQPVAAGSGNVITVTLNAVAVSATLAAPVLSGNNGTETFTVQDADSLLIASPAVITPIATFDNGPLQVVLQFPDVASIDTVNGVSGTTIASPTSSGTIPFTFHCLPSPTNGPITEISIQEASTVTRSVSTPISGLAYGPQVATPPTLDGQSTPTRIDCTAGGTGIILQSHARKK